MFRIISRFSQLNKQQLLAVYSETLDIEAKKKKTDRNTEEREFLQYIQDDFFSVPGALYAIWERHGCYVSAVRLEPYMDGCIISCLETAPNDRRKGYATKLLGNLLCWNVACGNLPVYSHIAKNNHASITVHRRCGFWVLHDFARLLDGTVSNRFITLCR